MSIEYNYKPIIVQTYQTLDEIPIDEREKLKTHYLKIIRDKRNQLLKDTDKYLIPDFPITPENLIIIKEYRQALRDYMNIPEVKNYNLNNSLIPDFPKFPF